MYGIMNNVFITGINMCYPVSVRATYLSLGAIGSTVFLFIQEPIMKQMKVKRLTNYFIWTIKSGENDNMISYFYFQFGVTCFVLMMTLVFVCHVFNKLPAKLEKLDQPRQMSVQVSWYHWSWYSSFVTNSECDIRNILWQINWYCRYLEYTQHARWEVYSVKFYVADQIYLKFMKNFQKCKAVL